MDSNLKSDELEQIFLTEKNGHIYRSVIATTEKILIERALKHTEGNQLTAARMLGINRNTLRSKIRKFNIDRESFKHE